MKNSSTSLVLIFLLVASFLTFAAAIPAYGEGEESNQQTLTSTLGSWTWIIAILIVAVLAGALLLFIIAFLQHRRRKNKEEKQRTMRIRFVR